MCPACRRYRGNLTNVMRSAPQKALDFFAFDLFKAMGLQTFAAAAAAGATSSAVLYPLEVRMLRRSPLCAAKLTEVFSNRSVGCLCVRSGPAVCRTISRACCSCLLTACSDCRWSGHG